MRSKIMEKLKLMPFGTEAFRILAASLKSLLKYAGDLRSLSYWDAPVLPDLGLLDPKEIEFLEAEADKEGLTLWECQVKVQRAIPRNFRKRFSAYYTNHEGLEIMASVLRSLRGPGSEALVLADPFLGSGLTLTTGIGALGPERVREVWGIEPLRLPALVAYASLVESMGGRREKVKVILGDAFEEIRDPISRGLRKADVILTNPPFTRWRELEREYREHLLTLTEELGYSAYIIRREVSLQALSMFICDLAIREGGLLISVLPASTFYTIYGRGLKILLKEKYRVHALIGSPRTSFSEGSGFKEVILVAEKNRSRGKTAFIEVASDLRQADLFLKEGFCSGFDINALPRFLDTNWLALLGSSELRGVVMKILESGLERGTLIHWEEALGRASMIRGIEMYGPEFFFIPNGRWGIVEEERNSIVISDGERNLEIAKDFLLKTLRKPSFYSRRIEAGVSSYMLSIPPVNVEELPDDIRSYVEWGMNSGRAMPAIRNFGRHWYSHVYKQVKAKNPFGNLFIPDKVDLNFRKRGVFANYTRERVTASKNFYIVRIQNDYFAKLLAGWFNSTIFISLLVLLGRKISDTWTRFLESDYLQLPVINLRAGIEAVNETIEIVERILKMDLPPFWEQIGEDYRRELDLALLKFIGVRDPEISLDYLYKTLYRCCSS